jgi:hypothetical protein
MVTESDRSSPMKALRTVLGATFNGIGTCLALGWTAGPSYVDADAVPSGLLAVHT